MGIRSSVLLFTALAASGSVLADDASFSTLITTPLAIEGLTGDDNGNLYTPGRSPGAGLPCPVWKIPLDHPQLILVGNVPAPSTTGQCSPSGLAFGPDGQLYVTETDRLYRFTPSESAPPTGTVFATGIPGTNGLVFDRQGNIWTGDGTTGQGRVWRISPAGAVAEVFRIQPMANAAGVGRDVRTLPTGNSQPLVANGLVIDHRGYMYIADTARGAIWRVRVNDDGSVTAGMGCDSTFTANTLCLDNVWAAHPLLEGADGILLDISGNIWVDANERNAIVFAGSNRSIFEVFRNPPDGTPGLRNTGPLETPTSPVLVGHKFCTANSDGNRRDNSPNSAGEIPTSTAKGKISCLDQDVIIRGLPIPLR